MLGEGSKGKHLPPAGLALRSTVRQATSGTLGYTQCSNKSHNMLVSPVTLAAGLLLCIVVRHVKALWVHDQPA